MFGLIPSRNQKVTYVDLIRDADTKWTRVVFSPLQWLICPGLKEPILLDNREIMNEHNSKKEKNEQKEERF